MTTTILLIIALIAFLLAAFNVSGGGHVQLIPLGLALAAAAWLAQRLALP